MFSSIECVLFYRTCSLAIECATRMSTFLQSRHRRISLGVRRCTQARSTDALRRNGAVAITLGGDCFAGVDLWCEHAGGVHVCACARVCVCVCVCVCSGLYLSAACVRERRCLRMLLLMCVRETEVERERQMVRVRARKDQIPLHLTTYRTYVCAPVGIKSLYI